MISRAIAAVLAVLAAGCSTTPDFVRNSEWVRRTFYPPVYPDAEPLEEYAGGASFDHGAWTELLGESVSTNGWVRYGALLRRTAELDAYLTALARADVDRLRSHERLALFINAYNAFTVRLILEHPRLRSILDIPEPDRWRGARWVIGGRDVSLYDLEHEWIRREYAEPRVHFALVCASAGCPRLRNEAYEGSRLDGQLADQERDFFSRRENARIDGSEVWLSEILDWYRDDFAAAAGSLRAYVAARMAGADDGSPGAFRPRWIPYDWRLNGSWTSPGPDPEPARSVPR